MRLAASCIGGARRVPWSLALLLLLGLAACTTSSGRARIETVVNMPVTDFDESIPECAIATGAPVDPAPLDADPTTPAFAGLLRAVGEPKTDVPVRRFIFHTHGMGMTQHCRDFMDPLTALLKARGYRADGLPSGWLDAPTDGSHYIRGEALRCKSGSGKPCRYDSFGQYRIDRLKGPAGDEVVVYSYFWHRDLWRAQLPFVNHDLAQDPGLLAKPAKELVDGGLGDAASYLGELGVPLREGMSSAICAMLVHAATGKPAPDERRKTLATGLDHCLTEQEAQDGVRFRDELHFGFLSHSLGSRMLFDVLSGWGRAPGAATPATSTRTALAYRTDTFFMAANQLPLLGPGRVTRTRSSPPEAVTTDVCANLPGFLGLRCRTLRVEGGRTKTLDVVGFVDPGDLLGFRVSGGIADETFPGIRFVNVRHRNAPQVLLLGTWPTSAHDKELQEPSAAALILCGGLGKSPLKARPCGAPR